MGFVFIPATIRSESLPRVLVSDQRRVLGRAINCQVQIIMLHGLAAMSAIYVHLFLRLFDANRIGMYHSFEWPCDDAI